MKTVIRYAATLVCAAALCGCATMYNPATERKEFIFINSQTEYAIGKNVVPELLKKSPLSDDSRLQERVSQIGRRIAAVSDRKDITYSFAVLADKDLNALTLPGGHIYVNAGLMEAFNDDELAYVVGHETGHVAARHIAKKMQATMAYQLILGVAFASAANANIQNAGTIAKGVDAVYNLVDLSYSRKDEFEADTIGVKYALKAGFEPSAALSALEKLKQGEGSNWKVLRYFRTHPFADERIKALKESIPRLKAKGAL